MSLQKYNNCTYINYTNDREPTKLYNLSVFDAKQHLCNGDYWHTCDPQVQIEIACSLKLPKFDVYVFLIFGFVALLCSCFILITFIKYKQMRQRPGDIILAISFSELCLVLNWLWIGFYRLTYDISPTPFDWVCEIQSFFSLLGGIGEFIYNCAFCIYILKFIQDPLNPKKISTKLIHLFACIAIAAGIIFSFTTHSTGLSLFCTCSVFTKPTSWSLSILGIFVILAYCGLSIFTLVRFQQKVPNNEQFAKMRSQFLNYYRTYVICTSVIWSLLALSYFFVTFNSFKWLDYRLNVFVSFGNTAKLGTPIALSITRFQDPLIRKKLKRLYRTCCSWCYLECLGYCIGSFRQRGIEMKQKLLDAKEETHFFDSLKNNLRFQQIYTIMSATVIALKQATQPATHALQEIDEADCQEKFELTVDDTLISNYDYLKMDNYSINEAQVCLYAPRVCKSLIEFDNKMINLEKSFNIHDNIKKIFDTYGRAGADGGASGEFQFFTSDNRIMIKTLRQTEVETFIQNLLPYTHHLANHPNSLISRIYAVLTIQQRQGNKLNILIMRNIVISPSKFKIVSYDLKGSSKSRSVFTKHPNALNEKKTLKDTDFQTNEEKIKVQPDKAALCSQILTEDSQFFAQRGWLDYSLLVVKVRWTDYCTEIGRDPDQYLQEVFQNDLYAIPSNIEPGIYYLMAIIDYLQTWDNNKKTERLLKQVTNFQVNPDISAVEPQTYSERFIRNIAQGIFIAAQSQETRDNNSYINLSNEDKSCDSEIFDLERQNSINRKKQN